MKTRQISVLILMLTMLAQAACAPTTSACPNPTPGTKLLTNAEVGYCLLSPAEYSTTEPQTVEVDPAVVQGGTIWQQNIIINPISAPGDIPGDAWLYIEVKDAAGKPAAQMVDEAVTSLGDGFNISTSEVEVNGEQAIVVDGLPGQDSNRQVFIVHNGRLYNLIFMPWFPNPAEPTPLENLYTMVMDTFHFLPQE